MKIEIPDWLIEKIKEASNGYDVPETEKEITDHIVDVVSEWADSWIELR